MAMSKSEIHRALLADIAKRRAALQHELDRLAPVEEFHRDELARLNGRRSAPTTEIVADRSPSANVDSAGLKERLNGATKHEAAELVLKHLGRPAKAPEIADTLTAAGYGKHISRRILVNGLHVAMDRKPDTFERRNGRGWALKYWPENQTENGKGP